MKITPKRLKEIINEEVTKFDNDNKQEVQVQKEKVVSIGNKKYRFTKEK